MHMLSVGSVGQHRLLDLYMAQGMRLTHEHTCDPLGYERREVPTHATIPAVLRLHSKALAVCSADFVCSLSDLVGRQQSLSGHTEPRSRMSID